jgi:hypothetical protein
MKCYALGVSQLCLGTPLAKAFIEAEVRRPILQILAAPLPHKQASKVGRAPWITLDNPFLLGLLIYKSV